MNLPLDTAKKTLDEAAKRIKGRRRLFSNSMGDDRFLYLNEQKLANGEAENVGKLSFAEHDLTDKSVQGICDVIRQAPRLREIQLGKNRFSPDGLARIFAAMENYPTLENVEVGNMPMGEKGAAALARLLGNAPALKTLSASNADLGDETMAGILSAAAKSTSLRELILPSNAPKEKAALAALKLISANPNLTTLSLTSYGWGKEDGFAEAFSHVTHRNLVNLTPANERIGRMTEKNYDASKAVAETLLGNMDSLDYQQLTYATNRLASAYRFLERHKDEGQGLQEAKQNLAGLLAKMPPMPEKDCDIHAFFKLNEHGYAPLDNPMLWQHPDATERLANLSLTQEDLNLRTTRGASLLESLAHGMPAEETVKALNNQKLRLGARELLDRDGEPNAVYNALLERHDIRPLFRVENWVGKSNQELSSVIAPLNAYERSNAPVHALMQQMRQHSPNLSRGR
ncbi:MAG: hypothetical protein FJX23_01210 [Alphaproteobacteria bacterium]|nr:hypothetical protein [Alphaproteobacteria bacterium]